MKLFDLFKTDEELFYYVRLSALLSDTLKSQKMSTVGFSQKIALCEINKLYALTSRLYKDHSTNVNTLFEETKKFHSEMSVKAFKDNYVLLFETILILRIADHEIQKRFISKFFTNVFQSKTPIKNANVLIKSIENILNSKKWDLFTQSLADHMLLACSTHLSENTIETRSTPPSQASDYKNMNFTEIFDYQEPHKEDFQNADSSSSDHDYEKSQEENSQNDKASDSGFSEYHNQEESSFDKNEFFDFKEQNDNEGNSGRSKSGATMERLRRNDFVTDLFLKELPHAKQINTMLECYKSRCRDDFMKMCIGDETVYSFERSSMELMTTRGEIMNKMVYDYENELNTNELYESRVQENNGMHSYLVNCQVFDPHHQKTMYSYNSIIEDSSDLFQQPNLRLLGTMFKKIDYDPRGSIKMPDGKSLDLQPIVERISKILYGETDGPKTLSGKFDEVSYDELKTYFNNSKQNKIKHNDINYAYTFTVESVVLEVPQTEGWQNPLVIFFVNYCLKSVYKNPMSYNVTIKIKNDNDDDEIEISMLFQRYFPDSLISYHYEILCEFAGIQDLPQNFADIESALNHTHYRDHIITVTKNYDFIPYNEYSCLQVHASGSRQIKGINDSFKPHHDHKTPLGYVYHFNNWTLVIQGNVNINPSDEEPPLHQTNFTLINKIPNEVLPRQSTSQLRLGPAAGAIPRMYSIVQRQQGPQKEYKLPEGKDWYVFGIVNHNLFGPQRKYLLETLSFYYFPDVDHKTKMILDIGRRIITAEIVQEYYPSIQTFDNMIAYMVKFVGSVKSHHGLFVTFMISASQIQVKQEPPPLAAYSEKWEEYLRKNGIYRESIVETSDYGEEVLENLRMSRFNRFEQRYQPVNLPNRRNPAPAPQRPTVPNETVVDYANRVNRPQLVPSQPNQPWKPSSQTNRKGKKRFDGRKAGFEGDTLEERDVHYMMPPK